MQFIVPAESSDSAHFKGSRDEFMKSISLELFNFHINIIYNNIFAVATMAHKKVDANLHHITTRYYFA